LIILPKPFRNDLIKLAAARALSYVRLREENVVLRDHIKEKYDFSNLIGYSECMRGVFEKIEKVSASESTVIIYGESGTGRSWSPSDTLQQRQKKSSPCCG